MKLASLLLVVLLGTAAHADDRLPVDPYAEAAPPPRAGKHREQLRRLLLHNFDRNHDGQLQPRERRQAARALRKLAHRMQHAKRKHARRQRLIRRFDRDGDGLLGPGELPPVLADELRPLDRNGDGWLDPGELP